MRRATTATRRPGSPSSCLDMDDRVAESLRREGVGHPVEALGRADHQEASRIEGSMKGLAQAAPGGVVEVDEEISTQDEVERPQVRESLDQVEPAELDAATERIV